MHACREELFPVAWGQTVWRDDIFSMECREICRACSSASWRWWHLLSAHACGHRKIIISAALIAAKYGTPGNACAARTPRPGMFYHSRNDTTHPGSNAPRNTSLHHVARRDIYRGVLTHQILRDHMFFNRSRDIVLGGGTDSRIVHCGMHDIHNIHVKYF